MSGFDVDAMHAAYVACALWSSTDNADDSGGETLDRNYDASDVHKDALAAMRTDCETFARQCIDTIRALDHFSAGSFGHDFWLTRNGHGAGFWDGEWPEPYASRLTDAAKAFGEVDLSVGDDGRIHTS